jgi:hypothetical protein
MPGEARAAADNGREILQLRFETEMVKMQLTEKSQLINVGTALA